MRRSFVNGLFALTLLCAGRTIADPLDRWTPRVLPDVSIWFPATSFSMTGFAAGKGMLVSVGQAGDFGTIVTSTDGVEWTARRPFPQDPRLVFGALRSLGFGNGTFVAVGWSQLIYGSSNGTDWVHRMGSLETLGSGSFYDITFGDGQFVAVGAITRTNVFTSPDGHEWTGRSLAVEPFGLGGVAHGNGRFVAVGNGSTPPIFVSTNGVQWTAVDPGVTETSLHKVAFGNGLFIAVGTSRTENNQWRSSVARSSDGITWSRVLLNSDLGLARVSFGLGLFVAVGRSGTILTSKDGETWEQRDSVTSRNLGCIGFGPHTVFVGGEAGTMLQSDPLIEVQMRRSPQLIITGLKQRSCRIEATDDLSRTWQTITTITLSGNSDEWTDPRVSNEQNRFYRAVLTQ